jgi:sugar/nucleoside kinase (ribokinase family)
MTGNHPPPKTELLCIGNAIVDVFAQIDSVLLARFGITEAVQHIPREQTEHILHELRSGGAGFHSAPVFSSGGGAANVAKIAAMLGINTAFTGSVGQDSLAAVFENDLRGTGAATLLKKGSEQTGLCLILNNSSETRIAASPSAALEFSADDVREDLIAAADAVVMDGYMLDRRALVQRVLHLANKHGIPVALDAASVFHIRERTEEILHYCRNYPLIVFMNADEAIAFYNTIKKNADDEAPRGEREKAAFILKEICPVLRYITEGEIFPVIVIKLGGRGAAVLAGGNIYREETFAIARPKDTTGAGDAFCAAFIAAWLRGSSITECAVLGNKVARQLLEVNGTSIPVDKLKSFAKVLQSSKKP